MLVIEGLTRRFGAEGRGRRRVVLGRARQLRRRDRPLRRRQVDAAAHDQPPGRSEPRAASCFDGTDVTALRGRALRALAGALRHDLPAVQPGRPPRRADQRADGPRSTTSPTCARAAASCGRDDDRAHRAVGAGAVRHGRGSPRQRADSCRAASSSASPSPARWCRSPRSSWPTSRSPRSIRATPRW